ncbi:Acidic amino acid decarboxylase GADL1 [Orchesella cincta]|uniref:Acidic amino acid decarboxylase GADL1 n=1 Tax=Orchesella cincta TaxID=48709 RepID=A0A1D2MNI7_ORCCI|nr:Acidic amino acid decarboxylase GADL1 [Orchesella cincta]
MGLVIDFIQPVPLEKELTEKLEKAIQSLASPGDADKDMEETAEYVMSRCVNTSHPHFLNQLYGGVHPMGLAAAYIVEKMNTNAHTYEVAPVFVLTERIILKKLRLLFFGNEDGDGIFAPGGSMANMYGYTLARHRYFPDAKQKGLFNLPPLVLYTSQDSHYSASKAANWMGLGLENVVKIKTNRFGAMIPMELEAAIKKNRAEGKIPLVVNATAGTTVLGAFDDLESIADICKRENLWLHCDAAWGGSFIFSERLRAENMKGIEKCDSIAWNAHKMLGAPLQCSIFITKEPDCLSKCNSLSASYLFQPDKYYPVEYDRSGDKSFQCGRKPDAFKLWFMWVALGTKGFQQLVEKAEDCARYISEKISSRDDCILYLDKHQCTNVFFWYVPPRLQGLDKTEAWWTELGEVTRKIKEKMVQEGDMMIGYSPLPHKNIPNAIRLVIPAYPPKSHADMDFVLEKIFSLGKDF